MAGGKNIGIGYRPLQGDVSNDILNWEDQGFKHGQVKREEEARKAAALAAKQKKAQEGIERAKSIKLYDTGSETLNETLAEAITIATNEYPKLFEVLDDETGKYSQSEKIKAQTKYQNILNLPENLKTLTNSVMGEYSTYKKGVDDGALFQDEDYEKKFQNGFKGITISLDDNGLPVTIFKKSSSDINADGMVDDFDVETMDSLNDAYSRPLFQKKFDYNNLVKQHSEKLVSAVNTDANGFKTTTKTGLEIDLLNESVNRVLYKNDGTPTDVMKSLVREQGLSIDNPEDLKKIENTYKNDLLLRSKRGVEEKFDSGAYVSNKRLEQENGGVNIYESLSQNKVKPKGDEYGIYINRINKDNSWSIQPSKSVKIGDRTELRKPEFNTLHDTNSGNSYTDATIESYTYDNEGNMVARISYVADKGGVNKDDSLGKETNDVKNQPAKKKEAIIQVNESVQRDMANFLNISINELKNLATDKTPVTKFN